MLDLNKQRFYFLLTNVTQVYSVTNMNIMILQNINKENMKFERERERARESEDERDKERG